MAATEQRMPPLNLGVSVWEEVVTYSKSADERSWAAMSALFVEALG